MADKPILFNAAMVNAILDGRKTQTRRVINPQPEPFKMDNGEDSLVYPLKVEGRDYTNIAVGSSLTCGVITKQKLRYVVGDRMIPAMEIPSLNRNYCADVFGQIWSRARDGETWVVLKSSANSRGYHTVTPAHEGKYRTRLVHRLIAEAFYGFEPRGLKQVRHLNSNQDDNSPMNLDWGTYEDNWSDKLVNGLASGENSHLAKLSELQVVQIRASEDSQRSLARKFGVAQATIWAIKSGQSWLENPKPNPRNCNPAIPRLTLVVTDVRVQRLMEISHDDCVAEGMVDRDLARLAFGFLWNFINQARGFGWDTNPWVMAVTFETHKCNIDQMEVAKCPN